MSDEPQEYPLGRVRVPCIAQPHNRISRRLGKHVLALFDTEENASLDVAAIVSRLGGTTYDVLCVFYPQLQHGTQQQKMSRWEFDGYATQQAWEAGEDDDDSEPSGPTVPELIDAFVAAVKVNRLDELGRIGKVVDPKRVKAYIDARLDTMIADVGHPAPNAASPISPSTSGASASMSTSPRGPISLASTG